MDPVRNQRLPSDPMRADNVQMSEKQVYNGYKRHEEHYFSAGSVLNF